MSEGAWKLPSYLLYIFSRFHVKHDDITTFMRHACDRAISIYNHGSETGPEQILVPIDFFKT